MDTVLRRRRSSQGDEPDEEAAAREVEYHTALSQACETRAVPQGAFREDACPGTLESGRIPGVGNPEAVLVANSEALPVASSEVLPVANPFHSERIHAEVQLIGSRPTRRV